MAGFLRSLLALDFFVVGMVEEGRSKVWDGICEGELWRCVHDGDVVSISVFMVCVQQGHFCSQRGPSREFLGSYKKELPSRASSDPIPVQQARPLSHGGHCFVSRAHLLAFSHFPELTVFKFFLGLFFPEFQGKGMP